MHVRKNSKEPAFRKIAPHRGCRVRIGERFKWVVGNSGGTELAIEGIFHWRERVEMILRGAVEPVRQRWFHDPGMAWPNVIGHCVKEKFHALLV